MTIAVAEALLDSMGKSDDEIRRALVDSIQRWGARYPYAGYGCMFNEWLQAEDPQPYGSYGNGSFDSLAMKRWQRNIIKSIHWMRKQNGGPSANIPLNPNIS